MTGCSKTRSGKRKKHTPYTSKAQTTAGNIALAVKKGDLPASKLQGASKQMAEGMTLEELQSHSREAKGKKLPQYVGKGNRGGNMQSKHYDKLRRENTRAYG